MSDGEARRWTLIGADSPLFPLPEIRYPLRIDTIGKAIVHSYGVHAFCRCGHNASVNLVTLGHRFGQDGSIDVIHRVQVCSACRRAGRGQGDVTFTVSGGKGWQTVL